MKSYACTLISLYKNSVKSLFVFIIVLAPTLGMMYWHDHDIDQETLTMAKMDGTEAEQFKVFVNHPHIRGLSYSKDLHQLFWISMDSKIQTWDFKTKILSDAYVSKKPLRGLDVSTSNSRIFFSIFDR